MYRSIRVALDGSAKGSKALQLACASITAGTTLHLVCVVDAAYVLPDPDDGFDGQQYRPQHRNSVVHRHSANWPAMTSPVPATR